VKYWDASAILPLLLEEPQTSQVQAVYDEDPALSIWCLTEVEVASALARRAREGFETEGLERARLELRRLLDRSTEINSVGQVRSRALRLLNTHALRAADAVQLSAALIFCEEQPEFLPFVCLDDRLRDAARREGFRVFPS
jgi:predicted nucleic acid-binding protein